MKKGDKALNASAASPTLNATASLLTLAVFVFCGGVAAHAQSAQTPKTTEAVTMQGAGRGPARAPDDPAAAEPSSAGGPTRAVYGDPSLTNDVASAANDVASPAPLFDAGRAPQAVPPAQTPPASGSGQTAGASSYTPPTARERFRRYVWDTVGPISLLRSAFTSGLDQARDVPPEWRQGAAGYGKRFASRFGQYAIQETIDYGLSEALRVDDGFAKSKKQGFTARLGDALLQNITARTRSGRRVVSVPRFASVYAGGIIPVLTWYPDRYNVRDGLRAGTFSLGIGFGVNVLREFVLRR
jgi:hypothetical protein